MKKILLILLNIFAFFVLCSCSGKENRDLYPLKGLAWESSVSDVSEQIGDFLKSEEKDDYGIYYYSDEKGLETAFGTAKEIQIYVKDDKPFCFRVVYDGATVSYEELERTILENEKGVIIEDTYEKLVNQLRQKEPDYFAKCFKKEEEKLCVISGTPKDILLEIWSPDYQEKEMITTE